MSLYKTNIRPSSNRAGYLNFTKTRPTGLSTHNITATMLNRTLQRSYCRYGRVSIRQTYDYCGGGGLHVSCSPSGISLRCVFFRRSEIDHLFVAANTHWRAAIRQYHNTSTSSSPSITDGIIILCVCCVRSS